MPGLGSGDSHCVEGLLSASWWVSAGSLVLGLGKPAQSAQEGLGRLLQAAVAAALPHKGAPKQRPCLLPAEPAANERNTQRKKAERAQTQTMSHRHG